MKDLCQRVKASIINHQMLETGETVVAGVSGGADSLCLFHVLLQLSREMDFYLQVVHVHHGLRESADADLAFVRDLCGKENVPCTCVRVDAAAAAREEGTGVEEAGRRLRYQAFEEARAALEEQRGRACRIAVAHHREDQAETVLFHLCRGTDLRGARGMLPVSGSIIRPLLEESREEIERYLTGRGLSWREDETNEDTAYTRNYLRREIFPRLEEGVNASAAESIARFADTCAQAERFLESATEEAARRCYVKEDSPDALSLRALAGEDPFLQGRILYACLAAAAGSRRDLSSVHVEAVRQLCAGDGDGSLAMPGGVTVTRTGGMVFFYQKDREDPVARGLAENGFAYPFSAEEYRWRIFDYGGDSAAIPRNQYTKWFDYDKIGMFPVFRTRQPGDRMTLAAGDPEGRPVSKKLARIMLDGRIPARIRDLIVLPFCGSEALWVPGLRMGDRFRVSEETKRILEIGVADRKVGL